MSFVQRKEGRKVEVEAEVVEVVEVVKVVEVFEVVEDVELRLLVKHVLRKIAPKV